MWMNTWMNEQAKERLSEWMNHSVTKKIQETRVTTDLPCLRKYCLANVHNQCSARWKLNVACDTNYRLVYNGFPVFSMTGNGTKMRYEAVLLLPSLLRSRFLGCHATLRPKRRLLTSEQHSFLIVFMFCLRSVEQTNRITAKCEWRKLSREKSGCDRQSIDSVLIMVHETPKKNCLQCFKC